MLTLPIPENACGISLHECFGEFLKEGEVENWECTSCDEPRRSVKKIEIVHFPPLLVIHLNRFSSDGKQKRDDHIDFELMELELGQYVLPRLERDNKYSSYDLCGVSNHYGSLQAGHYTAYSMCERLAPGTSLMTMSSLK